MKDADDSLLGVFYSDYMPRASKRSGNRYTFAYETPAAGEARFIHTYMNDGNPLPSFEGEPELVDVADDIDEYTKLLWESLNADNKVSLFVRYINIADGTYETRIVNKHQD